MEANMLNSDVTSPHLTQNTMESSWRGQLSSSALKSCLEEIQASDPAFPIQTVFNTLLRKSSQELQESSVSASRCGGFFSKPEPSSHPDSSLNLLKEKRKRGAEISERAPKRLRSSPCAGVCPLSGRDVQEKSVFSLKQKHKESKLSLSHRLKQQSEQHHHATSSVQSHNQTDSCSEDVLWTDKFSPQHSSELIGNSASVSKFHSWLKKWKHRADMEERRKTDERKQGGHDSWDSGDFQGEAVTETGGEEPLCNAILLTGPSGVGKTASVYACAQELGFKVFEVNSSSRRSGHLVLSQLKEATQSHLVEVSGEVPLKPAYFNNYSFTPKSDTLSGKAQLPKSVTSASKRKAAHSLRSSSRKAKRKAAAVTLARYFKMKEKADLLHFSGTLQSGKSGTEERDDTSLSCDLTVKQDKKTAMSLILFEEVDIIFEDDVGFLAAIKSFMMTTKRPVILTTNDPYFRERFASSLEEIVFKTPPAVNICSYLQLVCVAEGVCVDSGDVSRLFRLTGGDVRRCLLQLQLWVCSGGGWVSQTGGFTEDPTSSQYSKASGLGLGGSSDLQLPPYQSGCSAYMLGLHPVTTNDFLNFLKSGSWSETDQNRLLNVLAESWRRGVSLLYTNLELLLSLGAAGSSVLYLEDKPDPQQQSGSTHSDAGRHIQLASRQTSVSCAKSVKSISRLSRRKRAASSINKHQASSSSVSEAPPRTLSLRDDPEKQAATAAADCLAALADLFDLMSYTDATFADEGSHASGSHASEAFIWTGAVLKDGLLDEVGEEDGGSRNQERLQDLKAAVEGLGFHQFWWRVSETWTKAWKCKKNLEDKEWERLQDTLLLTTCSKEQSLSFTSQPLCALSEFQRRSRVSRMVLSSKPFNLLGNRQAVSVDYMPVLRSLCRPLRVLQQKGQTGRCWSYLSSRSLGLSTSTMHLLAEDSM